MSSNILKLQKSGGDPSIEVVVGHAHWGTYKVKLWDKNGQNPKEIGTGFSGDNIDDELTIGKISTLNDRYLSWKVRTASLNPAAGDQYQVTILIRQKGHTVDGGVYSYSGELDTVQTVGGFVKIQVV